LVLRCGPGVPLRPFVLFDYLGSFRISIDLRLSSGIVCKIRRFQAYTPIETCYAWKLCLLLSFLLLECDPGTRCITREESGAGRTGSRNRQGDEGPTG